jgi:hypothetical protein
MSIYFEKKGGFLPVIFNVLTLSLGPMVDDN